jgi:lipooligosaccharide transport system ATP-binding protein
VWNAIRQLRRDGKTILLTTHYMDEAEQLCDDLVIVDKGKVLERGNPAALITKHTGSTAIEAVLGWSEDGTKVAAASAALAAAGVPHERLPDRVIAYGPAADAVVATLGATEVIHRRSTLEDVFLRLTGRNLRE